MSNRLSRLTHWLWQHRLPLLRLSAGALLLWLVYLGGLTLYNRLTASPAKWQAEMAAGKMAEARNDYRDAQQHYQAAVCEARKFGDWDLRLAESLVKDAKLTCILATLSKGDPNGRISGEADSLLKSIEFLHFDDFQRDYLEFHEAIADKECLLDARKQLHQSLAIIEKVNSNDVALLDIIDDQVFVCGFLSESDRSMRLLPTRLLRQKLALQERMYGNEDPRVADTLLQLDSFDGYSRDDPGYQIHVKETLPSIQRAYAIREKHLSNGHELVVATGRLANLYRDLGDNTSVVSLWKRTIATLEKYYGAHGSGLSEAYLYLGNHYEYNHLDAQAIEAYRKGAIIDEYCPYYRNTNESLDELFKYFDKQHNQAAIEQLSQQFLALRMRLNGQSNRVSNLCYDISRRYEQQGDFNKASHYAQKALTIGEQLWGVNWYSLKDERERLSKLYQHCGKTAEADKLTTQNDTLEGHFEYHTPHPMPTANTR